MTTNKKTAFNKNTIHLIPAHAQPVFLWDNLLAIYTAEHWQASVLRGYDLATEAEVHQLQTAIHSLRRSMMLS